MMKTKVHSGPVRQLQFDATKVYNRLYIPALEYPDRVTNSSAHTCASLARIKPRQSCKRLLLNLIPDA